MQSLLKAYLTCELMSRSAGRSAKYTRQGPKLTFVDDDIRGVQELLDSVQDDVQDEVKVSTGGLCHGSNQDVAVVSVVLGVHSEVEDGLSHVDSGDGELGDVFDDSAVQVDVVVSAGGVFVEVVGGSEVAGGVADIGETPVGGGA